MNTVMRPLLVGVVLIATVLAGCAGNSEKEEILTPLQRIAYDFTEYSWNQPVAFDANGTALAQHPLLEPDRFPRGVQRMVPGGGAEPNIGITSSGAIFVTTFDEVRRSTDHGATWEVVHEFTSPGDPTLQDQWSTRDPMLWVDTDTDRVFSLHMQVGPQGYGTECFHLAFSDDDGESWSDELTSIAGTKGQECLTPFVDHPKIMTAPPAPDMDLQPVGYPNVVYVCDNRVVPVPVVGSVVLGTWCQVSLDGGRTFQYDTNPIPAEDSCAGINGHPAAHPDGTLVVPAGNIGGAQSNCRRAPTVAVSPDGGLNWDIRRAPTSQWVQSIDPDITFTPDGTGYYVFRADDNLTYLYRSTDLFQTWEGPWRLSPEDHVMNVFQVITSGDDGRISAAFLGTRTKQPIVEDPSAPERGPSDAVGGTKWHLFMAHSIDADADEPSFIVQQVNPEEDPVQVGCVWLRGGAGGPEGCRNLLDFIDMTRDDEGRAYVAITDGCDPRNGCSADHHNANYQSRDREISLAVQDSGESLFADVGILASLGIEHPPLPPDEATATRGDDA